MLDLSINETLARAVLTHVTTFLAMLPFLFFGGETIFGFALAMCWGIVIGAYSSIFVASPLQLILGVRRDAFSAAPAAAKGRGPRCRRASDLRGGELTLLSGERGAHRKTHRARGDPDRSIAASFAPRAGRAPICLPSMPSMSSLPASAELVSEPGLGDIRLQWWRDAIDRAANGEATGHPVADAVGDLQVAARSRASGS